MTERRGELSDLDQLRAIRSICDYAIFMLAPDGTVRTWNAGARVLYGYDAEEVIGKHVSVLYPDAEVRSGACERQLETAATTGRCECEGWRRRKDGSSFWADVVCTAVRDDAGALLGFVRVTRGPSEHRGNDRVLLESEERFRLLVTSVRDYAIFMLDCDGRVRTWNAGAETIKGYRAEEIIGLPIEVFYTPADRSSGLPRELLARARVAGRVEHEGWRVRKDGTRFWADVVITAVHGEAGELTGYAKVTRDLTERRNVEETLRQSEERLRLLIESVKDYAVFMLDVDGRVLTWNTGAERIKGYAAAEIRGRHFSIFYTEEDLEADKPARELRIASEQGRYEEESWRVRKDGTRFWAAVVLTAIRDASCRLVGFAKVIGDLTERRKLEEERLRSAQAHEAIRLRDEFLSIASHELKTPLAALQLQLESLREGVEALNPKMGQRLARALRSGERLADLVGALLDVSRIAAGHLELHPERFDLGDAASEVVERLRDSADKAGCRLILHRDGVAEGVWDRLRIEQVLMNLISNSIKYAAGTPITISIRSDVHQAVLEVSDEGPGIRDADLPRLFRRFERAASTRHYGGLGLGLYVTRQIVEAHGGTVTARKSEGGGACFVIQLPPDSGLVKLPEATSVEELH